VASSPWEAAWRGHCCIGGQRKRAGWVDASLPSPSVHIEIGLRRVSVPAGGDHRGGAVVPAAIDQFGQVIDVLVSQKRDMAATRRFFTRALEHGPSPTEVITDKAAAYRPSSRRSLQAPGTTPSPTPTTGSNPTTAE
jgi:hypothetical protein